MEYNKQEYQIIDSLINNNIQFALFKLPQSDCINLVLQNSSQPVIYDQFSDLQYKKGFVIAPYAISKKYPIIVINPDVQIEGMDAIISYLKTLNFKMKEIDEDLDSNDLRESEASSFEHYRYVYDDFKEELDSGTCSKLVLSRTFDMIKNSRFSAGASFFNACNKYPNSYIYLYHTSISGTWFGCSPERLISGHDGKWVTDALAGTKKIIDAQIETTIWDNKNKEEQQIVADYMIQQFKSIGIVPQQNKTETFKAGGLLHLRSVFSFQLDKNENLGNILNLIHPSPAINGFPKDKAFRFILDNEGYNRTYYSGFIGYLDTDSQTDLYVNLRCMQIMNKQLKLFAGGGILPSSDMISEWKETENKLQTIISVVENI